MRLRLIAALAAACLAAAGAVAQETPFRPVATVNASIITAYDVDQRARILAALGAEAAPEDLANLALDQMIEDRLKLQAAKQAGLEPTPEAVARGVQAFAAQLGTTPEAFRGRLEAAGVTDQAIEDLVAGQILWLDVVRERFRGRIELGEAEIDAEIALGRGSEDAAYRMQEIGLPFAADGRTEAETRALADRLYRELAAGGDFAAAVERYSRAPSAARGGEVGWIPAADIPPGLLRIVAGLPEGGVTPPQSVQGGLSILRVAERRVAGDVDPEDPELREQVRRDLVGRRLELLSQGLIQELRRDALIELR